MITIKHAECTHPDPTAPIVNSFAENTTGTGPYGEDERLFHVTRLCPICHRAYIQTSDYDFAEHYHFRSLI